MELLQRITHHPEICHGKPCIRGLRYPVEFVLELLSSGMTIDEILVDYADLEREDILAVLLFCSPSEPGQKYPQNRLMKFLVDAQLPDRLAQFLQSVGYDTVHTKNLPQQNATPDSTINRLSIEQSRIVITKDSDFVNSFLTIQQPYKLLLVTTGNLKNSELEALFIQNLSRLVELFEQHFYIEISRDAIVVHQ